MSAGKRAPPAERAAARIAALLAQREPAVPGTEALLGALGELADMPMSAAIYVFSSFFLTFGYFLQTLKHL